MPGWHACISRNMPHACKHLRMPAADALKPIPWFPPHRTMSPVWAPARWPMRSIACSAARKRLRYAWSGRPVIMPWPHDAMGFCLFNNVAIGARVATAEYQLDRVLIVDWDVHHGNGTQDTFWTDPKVGFFSIHRWPFYPGTGDRDETGSGAGLGTTLNLPVEFGTSRADYLAQFRNET